MGNMLVFQVPDAVLHMVQEYSVSQSCLEKLPSQGVRDHTDNKGVWRMTNRSGKSHSPNGIPTTELETEDLIVCPQTYQTTLPMHRFYISYLHFWTLDHLLTQAPETEFILHNKLWNETMLGISFDLKARFSTHREPGNIKIQNLGHWIWNVCLQTVWFHVCLRWPMNTNHLIWGWGSSMEET